MKLFIELFRFDAKSDYLPYYTKHNIEINNSKSVKELLEQFMNKRNLV